MGHGDHAISFIITESFPTWISFEHFIGNIFFSNNISKLRYNIVQFLLYVLCSHLTSAQVCCQSPRCDEKQFFLCWMSWHSYCSVTERFLWRTFKKKRKLENVTLSKSFLFKTHQDFYINYRHDCPYSKR